MNRKFGVIILAIIAVLCLSFAACNVGGGSTGGTVMTKEEALKKYIFEHEDSLVSEEFTLPKKIGGYRATWTSDSEYVVLKDRDDDYLATPVLPEEGQVSVNLKVDLRGVSDTYTVRVKAITAQDIADNYTFRQDKQVVYASFDLDLVASYKGRAADITWTVVTGSNISIGEDGDECIVVPSSLNPSVSIKAEFSYKGEVANKVYTFTVSEEMEHLQQVNHWYTNTGVSVTLQGYVVAIADPSYEQFGNISLYIVDEDFCCGYYLYQVVCDKTLGAKIRPGVFVTAEGTVNTLYNGGLYETTQRKGNITAVDETKTIEMDDPRLVHALDNDLISGSYATVYNQSRLVSLTNWTVDSVAESVEFGNTTLFTLKKGNVKVSVAVSKYLKGEYASATDPVYTALYEKYKTINKGDVVSVTGILGYYKGNQILPLSADDIVIGGEVGENDEVIGKAVKSAIAKVDEAFGKIPAVVAVDGTQSYELPSDDSVEISYRIIGTRSTIKLIEADGKKALEFKPDFAEVANIDVTFNTGDYVTHKFYSVRAEKLDDQGKADWEIKNFVVPTEITAAGDVDLPDTSFFENASVVWTSAENFAVVKGNVLTVSLPLTVKVLKLTATVTVGSATATRDYFVKVSAYDPKKPVYVESAPEAGTYLALAIHQENLSKTLYATNEMSGYYIATTEDYTAAAPVVLTAIEGGYTIQLGGKYFEIEISGDYKNVKLRDAATEGFAWTWNADNKTFQTTINGTTLYVGTYGTYNTVSASTIDKIGSSFPARLVSEVQTQTANDLLDEIVASIPTSATEDFALDFKASYELKEGSNGLELDGLTAKVAQTGADQTATLIVTVTYGKDADGNAIVATKEVVITIPAKNPAPVDGEYVLGLYQARLSKQLYVDSSLTISNGAFSTTEDPLKAATFKLATVEGGYQITVGGKILEITKVVSNGKTYYNPVLFAALEATNTPWTWNNTLSVMMFKAEDGNDYYLGAYSNEKDGTWKDRDTVSASKVSYISGSNAANIGVTQFPVYFQRPAPLAGEYIYGLYQKTLDKTLYAKAEITGNENNPDRYLATTEDIAEAAKFTVAVSGNGYTITVGGKYLELGKNSKNQVAVVLKDTSSAVWKWNDEAGVMTFTFEENDYYLGTYGNYSTISASKTSFVSGPNAANIGVTQFICKFAYAPETSGGDEGGDEGGETGGDEGGETSGDVNYGTLENPLTVAEALAIGADLEAGKATLQPIYVKGIIDSITNKYTDNIRIYIVDTVGASDKLYIYNVYYTDDITAAYVGDTVVVCGYLKQYQYNSTSKPTLEMTTENEVKTEFVDRTVGTSTISVADGSSDKATVSLSANSGLNGTTFTFTVTVTSGYEIVSVKVNGTLVTAVESTYTGTIAGPTTVYVETKEEGAADPEVVTVVIGTYGKDWTNQSKHLEIVMDSVITVTATGGQNTGKYYTSNGGSWRIYSSENGTLTFTAAEGYKIVAIALTYSEGNFDKGTNGNYFEVNSESVVVTATAKTFVTKIEVKYIAE